MVEWPSKHGPAKKCFVSKSETAFELNPETAHTHEHYAPDSQGFQPEITALPDISSSALIECFPSLGDSGVYSLEQFPIPTLEDSSVYGHGQFYSPLLPSVYPSQPLPDGSEEIPDTAPILTVIDDTISDTHQDFSTELYHNISFDEPDPTFNLFVETHGLDNECITL